MHRSELTVDLGALRRNVQRLLHVLDGAELWAVVKADAYGHGAVDVAGAALGAGASALCVATVPEALAAARRVPDAAHPRHGARRQQPRGRRGARREARARHRERRDPAGRPRAPQAGHGDGPLGPGRAAVAARRGGRPDEPPRHRGHRLGLHRVADRPLPGRHRAVVRAHAPPGQQRRCASLSGLALRRGPLRGGPVRPVALRHRSGRRRARARARLDEPRRASPGCCGPARAPATAAASWPRPTPGSGSCRSGTPTASAATSPGRRSGSPASSVPSWERSRWTRSPSGSTASCRPGRRSSCSGLGVLAEDHARVAGTINYELVCGINSEPTRARRVVVDA